MTMKKVTKCTPMNLRNNLSGLYTTEAIKVPQQITFISKPNQKVEAKKLANHPSFVKFGDTKRDQMRHLADHYKSATSQLFQEQLANLDQSGAASRQHKKDKLNRSHQLLVSGESKFRIERRACERNLSQHRYGEKRSKQQNKMKKQL